MRKSLSLKKELNKMSNSELKEELHQIIDRIEDDKILEAAYILLEKQDADIYSTMGERLTQREFELKIDEGEQDIKLGKIQSHDQVKEYFQKKFNG